MPLASCSVIQQVLTVLQLVTIFLNNAPKLCFNFMRFDVQYVSTLFCSLVAVLFDFNCYTSHTIVSFGCSS